MKLGLPEVPVLKVQQGAVAAVYYNRIRLTLARLGAPQEIVLGERGLTMEIDRSTWICRDRRLNDFPLVAWSNFDNKGRAGLHAPVRCQVLYYHAYARVVSGTVLAEIDRRFSTLLRDQEGDDIPAPQLIRFRARQ